MTKQIRGFYVQEFVPPGAVRVSAEALELARDFAATVGSRYVTAFDWAQDIAERAHADAPSKQLGPCMLLGAFERGDVPPEFLCRAGEFAYAVSIPEPVWQASAQRLIVLDQSQPFRLALI